MNKKLLFAAMALTALTACTTDDFESKSVAQQEASPVKFEVINNNDVFTRASMNGNKVAWSAEDGDLFTLYHGAAALGAITGYQNATYTAAAAEGEPATLSTPSMILQGAAIMVWPADTAFNIKSGDNLSISVPAKQPADIENYIPYVSEQISIGAYDGVKAPANTAGYQREYPIYMRPMASQLNLKTDYAGTDATLAQLYDGGSACPADGGIEPISLTSVDLVADQGNNVLTQKIAVKFSDPGSGAGSIKKQWDDAVANNAWGKYTDFDKTTVTEVEKLTTKSIQGVDGCKFLILPLDANMVGTEKSGVVVNTIYGKVIVAATGFTGTKYTAEQIADAWYRYIGASTAAATGETKATAAETSGDNVGKFKTTANIAAGLTQTLNGFSAYTATSGIVKGEPVGAAATRYVKVILDYLDMSDLHIKNDKHLRDAILVWNHIKASDVTVYLDGDDDEEFEMSQSTIALINEINAAAALEETPRSFKVKPCQDTDEECSTIVITGGGEVPDLTFIAKNGTAKVDVAFNADETWNWIGTVKILAGGSKGIKSFINRGTMQNAETATLKVTNSTGLAQQYDVPLVNEGTWNVTAGDLNVQFDVTNIGTVNISEGAEYHQDGTGNDFTNEAYTLPARFLAAGVEEEIGLVNNSGVFATVHGGHIDNYGLIEHLAESAKTYITSNDDSGTGFAAAFNKTANRIGRINLPYSNKDEDNISINAAANAGFVSVTVSTELNSAPANGKLSLSSVGANVNYCIIKSGVTEINAVSSQIKYLEFDAGTTEIAWNLGGTSSSPKTAAYDGLIVNSPINIKLWTNVTVAKATYINAKMYVGGTFTNGTANYNGYYGDTTDNATTMYITY